MIILQSNAKDISQNIQILLGGFETKTGEQVCYSKYHLFSQKAATCFDKFHLTRTYPVQWLALRDDGKYSAADYAKVSSENLTKNRALGVQKSWNPFEQELTIKRKREFVIKLLRGAMSGLAYMHDHDRLHQSLGPSSVVLKYAVDIFKQLLIFSFSVGISLLTLKCYANSMTVQ